MKRRKQEVTPETSGGSKEQSLYEAMAAIKTPEEAQAFLNDLCTPSELQAMQDRWRVVKPLMEGKSYRDIYEETGVSLTTIGRVARFIHLGHDGYRQLYERLKEARDA